MQTQGIQRKYINMKLKFYLKKSWKNNKLEE